MLTVIAFAAGLLGSALAGGFPDCQNGRLASNRVCDSSLSPRERAQALIEGFSLEEKINLTWYISPGVPDQGLPPYNWWSEALHGVASSPGVSFVQGGSEWEYATSFPEPIGLGASFDDELVYDVASIIGMEGRAFGNNNHSSLDFWTPNINPFRDPRWGRGQETPGEDPFRTASYVYQLINGLQGGIGPYYDQIVATAKHFAGYDMEDSDGLSRHEFSAQISTQDLSEYYLPPFKSAARDAKVGAIMCSYNAINGVPTCASPYLMRDILRDHWHWTSHDQWITSDCGAVTDIYDPHNYTDTPEQAVADALNAGTDLDCGTFYPQHFPAAIAQNLTTEANVDRALVRLYTSLVHLGYFDSPANQTYRSYNFSNVDTPKARELAYKAAVEGTVLLKNDGILPLSCDGKTIALIGPWGMATTQMQGNYFGVAPYLHSPLYAAETANISTIFSLGTEINTTNTSGFDAALRAAKAADVVIYAGGIDNSIEAEGMDRTSIAWPGNQLDLVQKLSEVGRPLVVLQMGGGQVDSSSLRDNPNVNALLWGGYPGQDGGTALIDIITGEQAPAGRLPVTQYPADFADEVEMINMDLRPVNGSPGRTYRWYTGSPVYEYASGLHYTNFSANFVDWDSDTLHIDSLTGGCHDVEYPDLAPFKTVQVEVTNTGSVKSDYVALLFLKGEFGPQPYPKKTLVGYQRLHDIHPGSTQTANVNLTLSSVSRTDEQGNLVLYPGAYSLVVDNDDLATYGFSIHGDEYVLDHFPQPSY